MKSLRTIAIITGVSLLVMAIAAGFSYGFIYNKQVIPTDAGATVENIINADILFRAGILGWLIIFITDVIVAWGLYVILKDVNQPLSLLTGWLRLAYAGLLGVAIMQLIAVVQLVDGGLSMNNESLNQQVLFHLHTFEAVWSAGLIVFGLHLLILGYLLLQYKQAHSIFGILLIIAAAGYLFIHVSELLRISYGNHLDTIETVLSIPMALGEIVLALWLVMPGGKAKLKA